MTAELEEKISQLPAAPGVYLYKDAGGTIIYIGKARSLRHRVRSYFQDSRGHDPKTDCLVAEIRDLETIVTGSEYEAFLLESNLVRQRQPRYNVVLKDDKSFPFIRLTVQERFPRISLTRRPPRDGARYFGPFIPAGRARFLIDTVRKSFGIRHCRKEIDGTLDRPCCLDYHIHRCLGPCVAALCGELDYRQAVAEASLFLEGKSDELARCLESRMSEAASAQRYEEAATLRDRLAAVRSLGQSQQVIMAEDEAADIFGYFHQGTRLAVQVFHLRHGKVIDRRQFFWEELAGFDPAEFLRDFLQQFYLNQPSVPPWVFLPAEIPDRTLMERWLTEKRGAAVRLRVPRRGRRARLLQFVARNARHAYAGRFPAVDETAEALSQLQAALALICLPRRVEAFDISNTQGREVVAALVVAEDGKMSPRLYRRYKVRSVEGAPDDFAAMREVVFRRYSRLLREASPLPELILVDGGAGQVSAARASLAALDLTGRVGLCGLAKREEEIFLPQRGEPVRLPRTSPALKLLQRIRDEAHRFAVGYHRRRRSAASFSSRLDDIPGLGPKRKKQLLQHFGSWRRILGAGPAELGEVLGRRTAEKIYRYIHADGDEAHEDVPLN